MRDTQQMLTRLTPLAEVFPAIYAAVSAVAARDVAAGDALYCVLAADAVAARRPVVATALRDGWAVNAAELADAGGYAPAVLAAKPVAVETGDAMPAGSDAVAPPDSITIRGNAAEASSAVAPGDGVLPAGADCDPERPLRKAGQRLRSTDIAALIAADIINVSVRVPRVTVVAARDDPRLRPALELIARDCAGHGAKASLVNGINIVQALADSGHDALIVVGGSGAGGRDASVAALRKAGRIIVHGIGLAPGETSAFGEVAGKPVLIVPGRLDAALAAWLVVGRRLLARLTGATEGVIASSYSLTRKVSSTVGLVEVVPVRIAGTTAEPLAAKFWPLSALTGTDGYILIPAGSEGFAPGTDVAVNRWP